MAEAGTWEILIKHRENKLSTLRVVKTWDRISTEMMTMTVYVEAKMSKLGNALRFPSKWNKSIYISF